MSFGSVQVLESLALFYARAIFSTIQPTAKVCLNGGMAELLETRRLDYSSWFQPQGSYVNGIHGLYSMLQMERHLLAILLKLRLMSLSFMLISLNCDRRGRQQMKALDSTSSSFLLSVSRELAFILGNILTHSKLSSEPSPLIKPHLARFSTASQGRDELVLI